jgi:hemolysin III
MTRARFKEPVSGLSHLAGCALGAAATTALAVRSWSDPAFFAASVAYGVSLVLLYAASSVYHLTHADERKTRILRTLDRSSIFLFIAGTSTPYFLRAYGGDAPLMIGIVWGLAILGVLFKLAWFGAPRWIFVALYVAMGWMAALRPTEVVNLPGGALAALVAGGVVYTVGALVYGFKRPNPWPPVLGFHELWHGFVLVASMLHFWGIWLLAPSS